MASHTIRLQRITVTRGAKYAIRSLGEVGLTTMHYVYLIESIGHPRQRYVGLTDDLKQRMADHNAGRSVHTAKYRPWALVAYIAFASESKAREFERYLKVGSGHAFARRHLWPARSRK